MVTITLNLKLENGMTTELLIALVSAGSGLAGAVLNHVFSKKKNSAEAESINVQATISLTEGYVQLIDKLKDEVSDLQDSRDELQRRDSIHERYITKFIMFVDRANNMSENQHIEIKDMLEGYRGDLAPDSNE